MKKLVVTNKSFSITEYSQVFPWISEEPFIAPFQRGNACRIGYTAYAEWNGDNSSRNVKISGQNLTLPPSWQASVGLTFSITLPTTWVSEGFELGTVTIFVSQSNSDYVFLSADIISINGNNAEVTINSVISSVGSTPIETEEDSICFLQDLTSRYQPSAMVVRDGEEGAFFSALNPNASAFGANPDRAELVTWYSTGSFTPNLPYWAQQWGWSSWPAVSLYDARFNPYHVWAIQDDYDLDAQQNQNDAFTNTLRLLFGIKPDFYTHYKLRTAHVNCREEGSPTGGAVALTGSNGNWQVNITPPPGGTLVASWIALTNAEAAHQGASQHAGQLVQQSPHYTTLAYTDTTTFVVVPPNPQAIAVAVFDFGGSQYGVRVSNRVSILPPPSSLVKLEFADDDPVAGERWVYRNPYPWDAVGARIVCDPSIVPPGAQHPFIKVRWWAFVKHVSGQTWMLEDAEFEYPPYSTTTQVIADVTELFHFCYGPFAAAFQPQANTEHDARLYLAPNNPLKDHFIRTYAAVYHSGNIGSLSLAPATGAPVPGFSYRIGAIVETAAGIHYSDVFSFDYINNYTAAGTFSGFTWQPPPTPPVPAGRTLRTEWRLAIFKGEFGKTPVWQDDFQHNFANAPIPPIAGPHPGGVTYTFNFNQPSTPGNYILFARLFYYIVDSSNIVTYYENYAEYTFQKVTRPILLPDVRDACAPCIPATEGEIVNVLYFSNPGIPGIVPAGDAFVYSGPALCDMPPPNCGYTIVHEVPPGWIDFTLVFDNYIKDTFVSHPGVTIRLPGTIRRIDDTVLHEKFVRDNYNEDTIIRSFKRTYEAELFINTKCMLYQAELIKYSLYVDNISTRGDLFLKKLSDLVVEDFRVRDVGTGMVITIRLTEREWRTEAYIS